MIVFLNGQFVPEEQAVVSVFDRGFLYGDGLFETMRVFNGKPFRWEQHLQRLERGGEFLNIRLPFSPDSLCEFAKELLVQNGMRDALLRLTLSRGIGPRGYSPRNAERPSLVMSLHSAPAIDPQTLPQWRLVTSSVRLAAGDRLAQFKTCNKLPQVLARAEADAAGADEALLLNTNEHVVEGASSNLFWIQGDAVCTPPITAGNLPGVTRAVIFEICRKLGISIREENISSPELRQVNGIFLSLSSVGIAEALLLDGENVRRAPLATSLQAAYWKLVQTETA